MTILKMIAASVQAIIKRLPRHRTHDKQEISEWNRIVASRKKAKKQSIRR